MAGADSEAGQSCVIILVEPLCSDDRALPVSHRQCAGPFSGLRRPAAYRFMNAGTDERCHSDRRSAVEITRLGPPTQTPLQVDAEFDPAGSVLSAPSNGTR